MRVAQVRLNQDMSFGQFISARDLKAVRRLEANGLRVVEGDNAWRVLRIAGPNEGEVVSEIPGKRQTYSKIAKQLLG